MPTMMFFGRLIVSIVSIFCVDASSLFAATGCTGLLDLLALDGQASSGGIRSHELDFSESSRRGGRGMLHALVMHCGCGGGTLTLWLPWLKN